MLINYDAHNRIRIYPGIDHPFPAILLTVRIIAGIMLTDMFVALHYSGRIHAEYTTN